MLASRGLKLKTTDVAVWRDDLQDPGAHEKDQINGFQPTYNNGGALLESDGDPFGHLLLHRLARSQLSVR